MAALTVQDVVPAGLAESLASAAGGGDTIAVDSSQLHFLEVVNGGGGSINVTIAKKSGLSSALVKDVGTLAIADVVVAVGAGASKLIGPFSDAYIQANGTVSIAYSGVTSVTVRALRLPKAA